MKVFAAIFLALLLGAGKCQANILQFLYIEAAEGNSSGGHVALRVADKIYHYQYDDGYIRLFRQMADGFLNDYRFKQNRSVHAADIKVSGGTFARIEDYFKVRYQQQKQQRSTLKTSRQDLALIRALLALKRGERVNSAETGGQLPRLSGAGLFYRDQSLGLPQISRNECDTAGIAKAAMPELRSKLWLRYGEDFIERKISGLRDEINRLEPVIANSAGTNNYGFSERYSDLMTGFLALEAIQHQLPLLKDACFQLQYPGVALNPADLSLLIRYRETLAQSVQSLADSKRPDWGYALFVSLARLSVVERTLQTRRWTFLDDTDGSKTGISGEDLALYGSAVNKLRRDDEQGLVKRIKAFAGAASIDTAYATLEVYANRYRQWRISDSSRALRYRSEQSLPRKDIAISPYLGTGLTTAQLEKTAVRLDVANKKLAAWDNEHHGYHLLTNNCVTALLAALNAAVSGQAQEQLGGTVDPKTNAIPFQAYEAVISNYHVTSKKKLPGYRELALTKLYTDEADTLVYARESNVLTSSLYRHHDGDAWFVFFTDDEILPRPIFGAFNVLAATSQSAFGLFTWPFDKGRQLKTGVKGVLASLPELAFFNIRKGSYPYAVERLN